GGLTIGPATGTFQVGGQPVNVSNGFALGNHDGAFSLSEANATQDSVTVSGTADFFTLDLAPAASSTSPSTAVSFQSDISTNFADSYTIRAYAPEGWTVAVDASGQVSAVPPLGATPAEYAILVTAQSTLYPELFVTAVHTVTTTAEDGLDLSVALDNSTTIPMGAVLNTDANDFLGRGLDPFGQLNNGQLSVPESAYLVSLTNRSTTDYTFDVAVNGLPAGWLLLSDAPGQSSTSLPLGAGASGQLGFYVVPTLFTLPAPGTSYNIEVTAVAQGNPALTETANISFTMPDLAFPYLHLDPTARYAAPGDIVSFDLSATNVGNQAASFPVEMTVKNNLYSPQVNLTTTLTAQPASFSTASIAPQATDTQAVTVDTTGTAIGQSYLLQATSAGAGYAPVTYGRIQIVSPESGLIFEAADSCTLDRAPLQASLEALALAVVELESWCALGDCPLPLRDNVVTAGQSVVGQATLAAQPTVLPALDGVNTAVSNLATQTDNADILAAIGV
ncbi:MAG: hypothetical protein KDD89_14190, partial [Anaerolineales bacterium]|nr:hypothetical protein [Anaerolineales bacterium]